jgi:hypothetical protein
MQGPKFKPQPSIAQTFCFKMVSMWVCRDGHQMSLVAACLLWAVLGHHSLHCVVSIVSDVFLMQDRVAPFVSLRRDQCPSVP